MRIALSSWAGIYLALLSVSGQALSLVTGRKKLFTLLVFYSLLSNYKYRVLPNRLDRHFRATFHPTFVPLTVVASAVLFVAATLTTSECSSGRRGKVWEKCGTRDSEELSLGKNWFLR
jgi:hypothetical protein